MRAVPIAIAVCVCAVAAIAIAACLTVDRVIVDRGPITVTIQMKQGDQP